MPFSKNFISLADLYVAYRKAKREAFSDTNCAHGLKYARFEKDLDRNLRVLLRRINAAKNPWQQDLAFLGKVTCIPKSITQASEKELAHLNISDPFENWRRLHKASPAKADFRAVINASVAFQVISALWILKVGHIYDATLHSHHALGNRLKRWRAHDDALPGAVGPLNLRSHFLFQPYFQAYGAWRRRGFNAMKAELGKDQPILAVTMDLRRFYHKVDASFLLNKDYLRFAGIQLEKRALDFTSQLVEAFKCWNAEANRKFDDDPRGLPVGLSASGLIANVLLKEFDDRVMTALEPVYYGRYVDDIFLVLRYGRKFETTNELMQWLAKQLNPITVYGEETDLTGETSSTLQITLPYAHGSELIFVGKKQKVFQLDGKSGLDLIAPIEEQIRRQRSEHRGLSEIPDSEAEMVARTLLVSPDATLDADSLRRADAATLRRSGFASLLGAVERHARDLNQRDRNWRRLRANFYGLAERHLLTPAGFFDYLRYFPRVLALMIVCDDARAARSFLKRLGKLVSLIRDTCNATPNHLQECCRTFSERLLEAVLQTLPLSKRTTDILQVVRILRARISRSLKIPLTIRALETHGENLFFADWSYRKYSQAWIESLAPHRIPPKLPTDQAIIDALHLDAPYELQKAAKLALPYWPALIFPTRPITIAEITVYCPLLVGDYAQLRNIVLGLRGTWMPHTSNLQVRPARGGGPDEVIVPADLPTPVRIAITNFHTGDREWFAAARGIPVLSLGRYKQMNRLINQVVRQTPKPTYLILPECSLPRRWARSVSLALSVQGISLIAGLEYRRAKQGIRNEVLVSLVSDFPGFKNNVCLLQTKLAPAWHEKDLLSKKLQVSFDPPTAAELHLPVYVHNRFCFGILICSDLTTLANRNHFQGFVDCIFVPEWNQDLETFGTLIEASAQDVHAYMIQANNRQFGDSRIRAPYKLGYRRDVARVRGGLHDYFVVSEIDFDGLRVFQRNSTPPSGDKEKYKPFPVGYEISARRLTT